ncbi:MAG TPA: hypothetical protein VKR57_04150 [Terriglobales bacterium]|jgi:hypothetical protein|nr:hypothetical protein [Terriglobales bacterium]
MELLLNLVWLTLALPAIWIWRHGSAHAGQPRRHSRLGACVLLVCVLVLLFPVISASDDLHPMRAEMEESSPFKRTVKQASSHSSATWLSYPGSFFAASISHSLICPRNEVCALISPSSLIIPKPRTVGRRDSRAPPSLLLG